MSGLMSGYEFEGLPELSSGHFGAGEANGESQQFFGALANLGKRGAAWLTATGSPQRQLALALARQALNQGLPVVRQYAGDGAASWLTGVLPQRECECESEISPIRKIYPDAMLEHLGHVASETYSEAEAEAMAGAMVPLAARIVPQAAPIITSATPGLVSGVSAILRSLRNDPALQPLVRVLPAIVRNTAVKLAQQSAAGAPVPPQTALRTLAGQTVRLLGSPQDSARAFRRSQVLDRKLHQNGASSGACPYCGGAR